MENLKLNASIDDVINGSFHPNDKIHKYKIKVHIFSFKLVASQNDNCGFICPGLDIFFL